MRTTRKQFPVNWLTFGRLAFTIQRSKARRSQQMKKKMAAEVEDDVEQPRPQGLLAFQY